MGANFVYLYSVTSIRSLPGFGPMEQLVFPNHPRPVTEQKALAALRCGCQQSSTLWGFLLHTSLARF
jgi:hypothetical protein